VVFLLEAEPGPDGTHMAAPGAHALPLSCGRRGFSFVARSWSPAASSLGGRPDGIGPGADTTVPDKP
jgi:hypothetical protein